MSLSRAGWIVAVLALLLAQVTAAVLVRSRLWRPCRPDVMLITIDTLRADRLGAYGHAAARTPTIDRLAAEGILFTQATTPFPRTTPALASLLTGLWPHHHGSREVCREMDETVTTLGAVLQRSGYTTVGVCANGVAGRRQRFHHGFDHFLCTRELKDVDARSVTDRVLQELLQLPAGWPLFLWVHYSDPHFPYLPREEPEEQPSGSESCRELIESMQDNRWRMGEVQSNSTGEAAAALAGCQALYDAEVAAVDREIGRLLDGFAALERDAETLLVFTSDHGENMGEAGLYYDHGPSVHDASMRVPLIISGDDLPRRIDHRPIRLEDLMPTLLGYLRVPHGQWPAMDGIDLSARLEAGLWPREPAEPIAFGEAGRCLQPNSFAWLRSGHRGDISCLNWGRFSLCTRPEAPGERRLYDHVLDSDLTTDVSAQHPQVQRQLERAWDRWPPEAARERTVRTSRYKLVSRPTLDGYRSALYDLELDPAETADIAASHPEVVRELQALLDRITADLDSPAARSEAGAEQDEETLELLRSLGYLQ